MAKKPTSEILKEVIAELRAENTALVDRVNKAESLCAELRKDKKNDAEKAHRKMREAGRLGVSLATALAAVRDGNPSAVEAVDRAYRELDLNTVDSNVLLRFFGNASQFMESGLPRNGLLAQLRDDADRALTELSVLRGTTSPVEYGVDSLATERNDDDDFPF